MTSLLPFVQLILAVLAYSSTTFSSPLNSPSQSPSLVPSSTNGSNTKTLLSSPWDPRFSIRSGYSNIRLQPTSTLMNAVNVAAYLANLDFNKKADVDVPSLPNYPEVSIDFVPVPPAKSVETKILVWGLYGAINDIVGRRQFRGVEFDLLWNGKVVAWLRFESTAKDKLEATNQRKQLTFRPTISLTYINNDTKPPDLRNDNIDLIDDPTSFFFSAQYTPYSKPLSIFQAFMSVFSALVQIAPFPSTSIVKPLAYEAQDFNSRIVVLKTERKVRPFFEYRWLIEGLKRILEFMLEAAKFEELGWKIEIDGKEVGSGYCEWTNWRAQGGIMSELIY